MACFSSSKGGSCTQQRHERGVGDDLGGTLVCTGEGTHVQGIQVVGEEGCQEKNVVAGELEEVLVPSNSQLDMVNDVLLALVATNSPGEPCPHDFVGT